MKRKLNIKKQDVFITLGLLVIILVCGIINFRLDGDVMWHYKTGEYIVNNHIIPTTDIFSWQENLKWMCHEWLYDVILFFNYSNLGAFATRIALTLAVALPIAIAFLYNRKKIKNPYLYLVFVCAILSFWNSSNCARPSEFSVNLLMIAAIYLIEEIKYKNIVFVICCFLCANIHGGSIAQLLVMPILFMISDGISAVYNKEKNSSITSHIGTLFMGFLATLINPYGINIYKYTTNIFFGANFINSHIREWAPNTISIITAVVLFGTVLCLGSSEGFKKFKKTDMRKCILILGFLCQGVATRRMMFNAACVLLLFSYSYIENFIFNTLRIKFHRIPNILIPMIGLAVITLMAGSYSSYQKGSYIGLVDKVHPELSEVMDYIKENQIEGRLFANYDIGGNLILHDIKTFVDPRCDPFIESFSDSTSLTDYFTYLDARNTTRYQAWSVLNNKYNFEYALLTMTRESDRELSQMLQLNGTEILFKNEGAVLYKLN